MVSSLSSLQSRILSQVRFLLIQLQNEMRSKFENSIIGLPVIILAHEFPLAAPLHGAILFVRSIRTISDIVAEELRRNAMVILGAQKLIFGANRIIATKVIQKLIIFKNYIFIALTHFRPIRLRSRLSYRRVLYARCIWARRSRRM